MAAVLAAMAFAMLHSCEKPVVQEQDTARRVFVFYTAGSNNLAGSIAGNIRDMVQAPFTDNNTLLIYSHLNRYSSSTQAPSYIIRAYNNKGKVVMDTLVTYPAGTHSASAETLRNVLEYAKENFPADEYGLLFSSHGTGFLPEYYYSNSSRYENGYSAGLGSVQKSIGQETDLRESHEIDIRDFADAIPFRLDYLIFDACLMGGAEVSCQLRNKAHYLVASPAEILSDGMNYREMTRHLFSSVNLQTRLEELCKSYYSIYDVQSGAYRSATISLIDLSSVANLAIECSRIFAGHRETLDGLPFSSIQQYYTYNYHWFYDLCDIVENLGCTEAELERFHLAFDRCVVYKAATDTFLANNPDNPYPGFAIRRFGGMSMYLPCNGGAYLDNYYRTLDWNFATRLVE
ncbi:MAG: clostripain-related cysteine peptidase [Bacteroides sp.]|nr:clostripain-related cysteine peptidase [Bacteroides sp.]